MFKCIHRVKRLGTMLVVKRDLVIITLVLRAQRGPTWFTRKPDLCLNRFKVKKSCTSISLTCSPEHSKTVGGQYPGGGQQSPKSYYTIPICSSWQFHPPCLCKFMCGACYFQLAVYRAMESKQNGEDKPKENRNSVIDVKAKNSHNKVCRWLMASRFSPSQWPSEEDGCLRANDYDSKMCSHLIYVHWPELNRSSYSA